MTSLKLVNRRVGSIFAVAAVVLSTVTPGILPAFASAAQVTERSIELSSSSKGASDVSYKVTFTPVTDAGAFALQFCENSPLIGSACTAPAGLDLSGATATGFTKSDATVAADNLTVLAGSITAATPVEVELSGVTNPTAAGPVYARIVTYADEAAAQDYAATALGSAIDTGSAAISITDTIGVSAAVLESMTFCVSGAEITKDNCEDADVAPTVKLGEEVTPDVFALTPTAVSTGDLFTQISTNAANGAVVSLKSTAANCGGLLRAGAPAGTCDIKPALDTDIAANEAKFGVKVSAATAPSAGVAINSSGIFKPVTGSFYNETTYGLNYIEGNGSGVTSTFGDFFLDTDNAPVSNRNMTLTFGASMNNSTPAGLYSTELSLIATGKF